MEKSGRTKLVAVTLGAVLAACGGGGGSDSPGGDDSPASYDGTWLVTVQVETCYDVTASGTVTVTGGTFSGTLFTYCANPRSGDTYLPVSGCGTDIQQVVSIQDGLFDRQGVEGNLFLSGDACNGGNGFYGVMASATGGVATSSWGTLTFAKQ